MTDIRQVLAANMKLYRKALGLSQEKLAVKIDAAKNYIALIEVGKSLPSAKMLEKIAFALEIDTPELFMVEQAQVRLREKRYKTILADIETLIQKQLTDPL
ncbi:MAG: helix-turn-helix domain-containing protein [Treponema sp.]|jgi:transcriptional regulator with XRE-family HTH domain|nr:helix-turn-helix domain-containing protein [Treponema sp.]